MPVTAQVEQDGLLFTALLTSSALSIAHLMACEDSGAGTMPSLRANVIAASILLSGDMQQHL